MLDLSNISNISREQFAKLDASEKQLVLKILSELKTTGKSETLEELWYQDYTEIPVSIDEFITNPHYLGKSTRNGTSIYPYWRNKYREVFDESLGYEEIILTGAIGVGKTRTAVVCLAYLLYKIMCLRNPQEYFKFNEGDKITIFFLNINLRLAEGVGYMTLHEYLLNSPWFMERGTSTGRTKILYVPPHNIGITFGSKSDHALGQQVFAAFMDEVDFTKGGIKGGDVLNAQNGIMQAYTTIKERINSRFIKNGVQYGRLFLVSSKKSEHDFIEAYIRKMKAENQSDHMLIVDEPQWVIKPEGTFSKETFPVAVGNRSLKSRVLNEHLSEEERKALIKQGYEILDVPVSLKQSFVVDVNTALMNLAGRSVVGAVSFFNFDMFSKCYIEDYHNPFVSDILTIGIHDDLQIANFFDLNSVPPAVRAMPQFIHVDASLTGDKTGISSVGCSGIKETTQYNGAQEIITNELTYKHIFSVDIQAPQGAEISFEKTRQFIYYLKASGFNIRGVSLDGFQSADMKQMLLAQGYDASIVSLDKTPQGYLALRSAMNDGRIGLIQIDLLETELIQLQRDVQTGRIDHPTDGCFTADTLIQLVDGRQISIADLLIEQTYKDNYVYTFNESTKCIEPKKIKKVFQTKLVTTLIKITLDNGAVVLCTPEHRFMLRDGSYCEAYKLQEQDALMPLYLKMGSGGYKNYRMYYEPIDQTWKLEHLNFCNVLLQKGCVIHHCNFNPLDNRPTNLKQLSISKHIQIHNNHTKNYDTVSNTVKLWHSNNRTTEAYKQRSLKCQLSTYNYLKSIHPDYIPRKVIESQRIQKIEDYFNICWNELTPTEKNSYSVKFVKKFPEYKKTRIIKNYTEHEKQQYKIASERASGRIWITNGTVEKLIHPNNAIPDGFYRGRKQTNTDTNYKNHKVLKVEYIHKPCRVYDLEIEDNHNFALASGVFVHNSKDMSDSLAGALWNATLHKQSLIDGLQLLDTAVSINEIVDPSKEIINDLQNSMMSGMTQTMNNASSKLDELLYGFNDPNIVSW